MRYCFFSFAVLFFLNAGAQSTFTSGGKLKPEQANMDIRHYTIALKLDIPSRTIDGYTIVDLDLKEPSKVLLFDLLDSFTVSSVSVNGRKAPYEYHNNLIRITMPFDLKAGHVTTRIEYHGSPHRAIRPPWDDGFTWTKDSNGKPWIAITAEGTGGKLYFPCKDHPSDEPNEGAELIITVPQDLVVAGPGLLQKVTQRNGMKTYDWKTQYSINNYSILFNVGNFKVARRDYTTVDGHHVPMEFYVLDQDFVHAEHHLDVLERTVHSREKYFGEYPWAKEKIGICETPHLGMEHQTMNAYGNQFKYAKVGNEDFDWLMDHEFGHEWWGNKITARDWADYWIHEGINTFGDALDIREIAGEEAYLQHFRDGSVFENKKPIVQGKDLDEEAAYINDIYGKGAFFMHSLRFLMGDSLFFPALKEFATSPKYTYDNLVSTDDVEQFFSSKYGHSLKPFFDLFLRTTEKLEIHVVRSFNGYRINLENLDMTIPLKVVTSNGPQIIRVGKKPVVVKSGTTPIIDPDMYYLSRVVSE